MNTSKAISTQNSEFIDIYPFKTLPIQLIFDEKIVNLAIKAASQQQLNSPSNYSNDLSNEFNCLFTASPEIEEETNRLSLIIDGFDQGKSAFNCNGLKNNNISSGFNIIPTSQVPGCIYVPVRVINNTSSYNGLNQANNKNLLESGNNQNQNVMNLYANSINLLSNYCTSNCISIDSISNFISIFSTIYYKNQTNTISADLYFDTISLANRFIAQPAKAMPILTTALSKALQSAINFYSTPKTGFCTIYQNNKILLVLESDPKANTLPLIGIWISGIRDVNHPLIWSACMRYKFSSSILKRINDEDDSFLIVLFPSTHKKPEFYKCTTNQFNLEFTLFSGQEKLITTKNLCNNMLINKASHIEEKYITVDLIEIKEGFKLKSFANAINETYKNKAILNTRKLNDEQMYIETPLKHDYQLHAYEPPINRSQCVSDISLLSDDGLIQQQQQQQQKQQQGRRFVNYDSNDSMSKPLGYENQNQNEQQLLALPSPVIRQPLLNQQKPIVNNNYSINGSNLPNNTHSMLFGIPRNPPLPIGFTPTLTNSNDFNDESKLLDNFNNSEIKMQQQKRQQEQDKLKSSLKKSPPIPQQQQQQQEPLIANLQKPLPTPKAILAPTTSTSTPTIATPKELFNNNSNRYEQTSEFLNEDSEYHVMSQNEIQTNLNDQQTANYSLPKKQLNNNYPIFTQTEPTYSTNNNMIEKSNQPQLVRQRSLQSLEFTNSNSSFGNETRQYNLRNSTEFYQQKSSSDFNQINDSVNNLIPTPKGYMTQQDLLNLVFKQDEQLKTLQEQINRLLATNQYNNSNNNTVMTDNSKNSDSSNEQRSISSLKSHLGNEMSQIELNNSQNSLTNKMGHNNSGGGLCSSVSIPNNLASLNSIPTVATNLDMKTQANMNTNGNNRNSFNEDTTMYRSIENPRCESPIMLFDQSMKNNDDLKNNDCMNVKQNHSNFSSNEQFNEHEQSSIMSNPKTKSDDSSVNSWKNSKTNLLNDDNNGSLKELTTNEKKVVFADTSILDNTQMNREDNDESFMNIFNSALKHLNQLGVNINEDLIPNERLNTNTNNALNSYYMLDSTFLPKLQYVSMYLDEMGDKNLSLEVNALAMKYLKDEQLTKVAKGITQNKRASFSTTPVRQKFNTNLVDNSIFSDNECENDGAYNSTICESNNLSLASKQYLEKYGISYPKKNNFHKNEKPAFDRSLSTPVTTANNVYNKILTNTHKQLYSDGDINNDSKADNKSDDEEIWLFGNPNSKSNSNDSYGSEPTIESKTNIKQNKIMNNIAQNITPQNNRNELNLKNELRKNNEIINENYRPLAQKSSKKGIKNDSQSYKVFENEDDMSRILDVENVKKLPKFL